MHGFGPAAGGRQPKSCVGWPIFRSRRAEQARWNGESFATSGGGAVVIAEHSAQALAAFDLAGGLSDLVAGFNQSILQPLMAALGVVVRKVLAYGVPQRVLTEEDHPVQALVFDGPHEPLLMRIQGRRPRRQEHRRHARLLQETL
jgi:hypothetical protein